MIPFKINGTKYNFPTTWEDVTYQQYIDLLHTVTLTDHIHVFTGIPRETLEQAEIRNLEKISLALSFLSFAPTFQRTKLVGPYFVPDDVTIQSLGQFEDLRALLMKMPKDLKDPNNVELLSDLYLGACAIYCQKVRDKGNYDPYKVPEVKEELKKYSCAEVIGTGAFFLFRPLNTLPPTTTLYQRVTHRMKNWMQALPGYRKTLDLLASYTARAGK